MDTPLSRALRRIAKGTRLSSLDVPVLEDAADEIDSLTAALPPVSGARDARDVFVRSVIRHETLLAVERALGRIKRRNHTFGHECLDVLDVANALGSLPASPGAAPEGAQAPQGKTAERMLRELWGDAEDCEDCAAITVRPCAIHARIDIC